MQKFIKDNTYHTVYKSLGEFLHDSEHADFPSTAYRNNEDDFNNIRDSMHDSWRYGSETTQENYLTKRFDPTKGKKLCEAELRKILSSKEYKQSVALALTYKKRLNFQDEGTKISVTRAITGEERCFIKTKNAQKPTVKIAINMCVSACVEDKDLMKIATAAIPVVYALEQAGICTEIWLCAFSDETHESHDFQYTAVEICVKTAQQRFNWTMFAPMFQVGTYRHGIFLTWTMSKYQVTCGFGRPMSSSDLQSKSNYGYVTVIGNNTPGPLQTIKELFAKKK